MVICGVSGGKLLTAKFAKNIREEREEELCRSKFAKNIREERT